MIVLLAVAAYVVLAFPVAVVIGRMLGGAESRPVIHTDGWLDEVARDLEPMPVSA